MSKFIEDYINIPKNKEDAGETAEIIEEEVFVPKDMRSIARTLAQMHSFIVVANQLYRLEKETGSWNMIPESVSNREIRRLIPREWNIQINKNNLSEIYEWLLIESEQKDSSCFFKNTNYLNFRNLAYNWKKDEIVEKRKKLYFRYALNSDFPKKSSTGAFEKFLDDIFKDDSKTRREFNKFIGLCISDIRYLKYCFFLYGPSNTGKSVMLNLLKYIVGEESCASLSFSQMGNEFAVTQLLGKRLNVSGEVSGTSTSRLDIFKSVTGNDRITACYKGKDHFQFENPCVLAFACNCFPKISNYLEFQAFISRIVIFPFLNVKPRDEWDNHLLDKLKADVPGVINCAIRGVKDLENDDYTFVESKKMLECKQYFIGEYDSFSLFADNYLVADKKSTVTCSELIHLYSIFCDINDYHKLADNKWPQILKRNFYCRSVIVKNTSDGKEKQARAYKGIRFNENIQELHNATVVPKPFGNCEDAIFNNQEEGF